MLYLKPFRLQIKTHLQEASGPPSLAQNRVKVGNFFNFYEPDNLYNVNFLSATPKTQKKNVALRNLGVALKNLGVALKNLGVALRNFLHAPRAGNISPTPI